MLQATQSLPEAASANQAPMAKIDAVQKLQPWRAERVAE